MPAPTPIALRQTVVRMLALEFDIPLIIAVSGLSERSVRSIRDRWVETGSVRAPETHGIIGRPRLTHGQYLCERITQAPDLFLDELQKELSETAGIEVSLATVWRTLARLGITCRRWWQLDKRAMERCEENRSEYRRLIRAFRPGQIVFGDESSFNRKGTYRTYGYALSGNRAS